MLAPDALLPSLVVSPSDGSEAPLVLVHGFTQSAASWGAFVDDLAVTARRIVAVDLPGHGLTDPALDTADLERSAAALGATSGRAVYIGYSMGGRVALRLALDRPDLVEALVLIGATAGIDDAEGRAARRVADEARADHLEAVGTEAFLDEWLAGPLFRGLAPTEDDLAGRRANRPEGLAASLRHAGTGSMDPPWWDELADLTMPVLVLVGENDTKFAPLAARLTESIGAGATMAVVADAGHAAHLEGPTSTAALIQTWLRSAPAPPPSDP